MTQQQKIRDTSTTEGIDSQGKDFWENLNKELEAWKIVMAEESRAKWVEEAKEAELDAEKLTAEDESRAKQLADKKLTAEEAARAKQLAEEHLAEQ